MAWPPQGVAVQGPEVRDAVGAERVQVDGADQLPEAGGLLDHDGLVPVLEEVPHALMAAVEGPGRAGEEPAHAAREAGRATPEQEVSMVREEGPRGEGGTGGLRHRAQARHEGRAVLIVLHDRPPLQPAEDDMIERPWGIEARVARHTGGLPMPRRVACLVNEGNNVPYYVSRP